MVLWKIWFDLRIRFFICLSFLILSVLVLIICFPLLGTFLTWLKTEIPPEEYKLIQQYASDYRLFMDEGWFREVQFVAAFAVVFALGGIMAEAKLRTAHLSLSFPVSRRRWILYQAGLALLLVMILSCVASLLIILGGFVFGKAYPLTRATGGTLLLALMTFPWIGATLAITSFTYDKLKTALVVFSLWFVTGLLEKIPAIRLWLPQHLLDFMEPGSFPWRSILIILTLGIGGLFVAIKRFEQADF
jgi:hypothetical protein